MPNISVPIARTFLTKEEIKSVLSPLNSGWLVQGPKVKEFEDKWSRYTQSKNSVAVTSCTSALHLSLAALGFKAGDEAIVPAFTWISTANVIEHLGGKVVFCDIDLDTFNIDINKIESKITKKTKAILPVHLFGLSADIDPINKLAKKHKLWVVEDAACGFGAKYKNKHVGILGDAGCFSFHPRKSITTGEGGMVTTNKKSLAIKIRRLRDHGSEISDLQRHLGPKPYLLADHPDAGYNQRMTDIQAALGSSQMDRAKEIVKERNKIANIYKSELAEIGFLRKTSVSNDFTHGYQSYACLFCPEKITKNNIAKVNKMRNIWMDKLQKQGISTRPSTHAVHMLKFYKKKYNLKPNDYFQARIANDCSVSLPLFNGMKESEIEYVIKKIKKSSF